MKNNTWTVAIVLNITQLIRWIIVTGLCPSSCVVRRASTFFTYIPSALNPLIWFLPNFTGRIPGLSPTKVVSVGCISRSQGQKYVIQNAIFKNLPVWNYIAESFHIWYTASFRGPLLNLFKLCPWGHIRSFARGHNFTLNYVSNSWKFSCKNILEP